MENTTVLPIYDTYFKTTPAVIFAENECSQPVNWEDFKTLPDSPELNKPLSKRVVDFSTQDAQNTQDATWTDSIKRVLKYAMDAFSAFFLYPLQRIVMIPLYPAQSGIVRAFIPHLRIENLNKKKKRFFE